jgi:cAMP-dependent protein kinase regulator
MSVSAEVFGKFNVEKEYIPPVHAKSEDQITKIKERMANNFLFASLNPKDRKAVLDAIVGVKFSSGD